MHFLHAAVFDRIGAEVGPQPVQVDTVAPAHAEDEREAYCVDYEAFPLEQLEKFVRLREKGRRRGVKKMKKERRKIKKENKQVRKINN